MRTIAASSRLLFCSLSSLLIFVTLVKTQASVTLPVFPAATFPITNYGASSSTTADNTSGIQQAIDACTAAGGGTVVIPSGTFLSGPITMKNNVNLQISSGATLRLLPYGTGNGTPSGSYPNSGTTNDYTDFIYAKGASNIAVTGSGTIDGQGSAWWTAYKANTAISRPCLIRFDRCSTLAVTGITLINAPNVHITIGKSSNNATLANLTINSPSTSPNTDGIDTWAGNINITNCNITCGDDNIAMDSESQNITVKHCTFGTGHGCSVGSYTTNVANILVDSCTFNGTTAGMRLKTARGRGGVETNITYSNITMTGVTNPIYYTSYYPSVPSSPTADTAQAMTALTPQWQHITLKNATITGSANAGTIWGLPEQSIVDVVFDNVQISAKTGMQINFATGVVFKNCSNITVTSGNAITSTHNSTVTGIDFTTGKSSYVISTTASPGKGGTVSGAGTFACGKSVSLTAAPASGYTFVNWTSGTTIISSKAAYTFNASETIALTANFTFSTGLDDESTSSPSLLLFPNPSKDKCTVKLGSDYFGPVQLTLRDILGNEVKNLIATKSAFDVHVEIETQELKSGTYLLNVKEGETNRVKMLVVQ
jgi:polygalacturonase